VVVGDTVPDFLEVPAVAVVGLGVLSPAVLAQRARALLAALVSLTKAVLEMPVVVVVRVLSALMDLVTAVVTVARAFPVVLLARRLDVPVVVAVETLAEAQPLTEVALMRLA
jgi:hypothetical protein